MIAHVSNAKRRRGWFVYGAIGLFLTLGIASQVIGYARYERDSEAILREVSERMAAHIGLVVQSQELFGILRQRRLEAAFEALTADNEIMSVAVLNPNGEVISSSGTPIALGSRGPEEGVFIENNGAITIVAPYQRFTADEPAERREPPLVVPESAPEISLPFSRHFVDDLMYDPLPATEQGLEELEDGNPMDTERLDAFVRLMQDEFFSPARVEQVRTVLAERPLTRENMEHALFTLLFKVKPVLDEETGEWRKEPPSMAQAAHVSEEEMARFRRQYGIEWFVCTLNGSHFRARTTQERHTRLLLGLAVLLVAGAAALAWRYLERASSLEMRLLRSQEMNSYLRDMNLAAAGLAHETKNPLNLIRGQAQMIEKLPKVTSAVKERTKVIEEEVDRVTARLNQFMDYSRPLAPQVTPCRPSEIARAVADMLDMSVAGKQLTFNVTGEDFQIDADPAMLRQTLFNLMLNAVEAGGDEGTIEVSIRHETGDQCSIEVNDTGPGVPAPEREEIFRPYYTRSASGTGLGLALVWQVALAHQWEVTCEDGVLGGACFRISGLRAIEGNRRESGH